MTGGMSLVFCQIVYATIRFAPSGFCELRRHSKLSNPKLVKIRNVMVATFEHG